MKQADYTTVCKACGTSSNSKYCPECGQHMAIERLSLPGILHEVFHFFTHLEHGFFYTLKGLIVKPGIVQREYVEGFRARHQKPFSMFFLCATISALIYYWINTAIITFYHAGNAAEADFFHTRFVLFHIGMFPLYCLISYLCFLRSGYNFGEIAVQQLYTFSVIFLAVAIVQVAKFVNPEVETRYIELPLVIAYSIITNLNFFTRLRKGSVVIISIVSVLLIFLLAGFTQDELIKFLERRR